MGTEVLLEEGMLEEKMMIEGRSTMCDYVKILLLLPIHFLKLLPIIFLPNFEHCLVET